MPSSIKKHPLSSGALLPTLKQTHSLFVSKPFLKFTGSPSENKALPTISFTPVNKSSSPPTTTSLVNEAKTVDTFDIQHMPSEADPKKVDVSASAGDSIASSLPPQTDSGPSKKEKNSLEAYQAELICLEQHKKPAPASQETGNNDSLLTTLIEFDRTSVQPINASHSPDQTKLKPEATLPSTDAAANGIIPVLDFSAFLKIIPNLNFPAFLKKHAAELQSLFPDLANNQADMKKWVEENFTEDIRKSLIAAIENQHAINYGTVRKKNNNSDYQTTKTATKTLTEGAVHAVDLIPKADLTSETALAVLSCMVKVADL
jgi:hypothetical protein